MPIAAPQRSGSRSTALRGSAPWRVSAAAGAAVDAVGQAAGKAEDGAPAAPSRAGRTALALLDAAEQLFAERGVDAVSVREIIRRSGQHNASATRYHFGSREALIVAVVERRMQPINAQRHQALDRLLAQGRSDDLRSVLAALVEPLALCVRHTEWGPRYVRIVAELVQHPEDSPETQWDRALTSAMARSDAMVRQCLPQVPAPLLRRRLRLVRDYVVFSLAAWVRLNGPVTPGSDARFRREVDTLIDFMCAGLRNA